MTFDQEYFNSRKYLEKEALVKRHVYNVLCWASKATEINLLDGKGKNALDIGCAYGYTSHALAGLGYKTVGTDISCWGIKRAKQDNFKELLVCDAQTSMPFKARIFDLVTCFDVLEHLPHPELALQSMFAVSKGTIVCTTPNRKVEKSMRTLTGDYDPTHVNVKSPDQWKILINKYLKHADVWVEPFFDIPVWLGGKLFFKSFLIPTYGLTVRIAVKV